MAATALTPPPPCWMWKQRSTKTDANAFIGVLRSIGGSSWQRRWVAVDGTRLVYGKSKGDKDKDLPFETFRDCASISPQVMRSQKAPDDFVAFGWEMKSEEKVVQWACESLESRDAWVDYVHALLEAMRGNQGSAEVATQGTIMMLARERAATVVPSLEASTADPAEDEDREGDVQDKTERELNDLVAAAGEDDDNLHIDSSALDGDWDEDEFSDNEEVGEDNNGSGRQVAESQEDIYRNFLTPLSQTAHNHIAYKIERSYKDVFKKDDGIANVVFSRSVQKIAKQDNLQTRDVIITHRFVYFVAEKRFGGIDTRAIAIEQFVGVIESLVESTLFALLVPSFHDILIRVTAQNSVVGGTEVDVKHQLIAHLYAEHHRLVTGRAFIFREAENVRKVIRRCEDDNHLPLVSEALDRLKVATNAKLYPTLRINADSVVYFSFIALRVNAQREQNPRAIAITDTAVYVISDTFDKILRRFPLKDITKVLVDVDMQGALFQCPDVDTLLIIKNIADFEEVQKVIRSVCARINHRCDVVHSKQLYSVAQLVERKKLMEHLEAFGANTEEGFKKSLKLTQKMLRTSWKMTTNSVKGLGSGMQTITHIGEKGLGMLLTGVQGVGEALVDNALTGGLLGAVGAAGDLFTQQSRVLHEAVQTLEDEDKLLAEPPSNGDTLSLGNVAALHTWKLGKVRFSSRCKRFNITSHIDSDKTKNDVVIVCDKGIYFFEDPHGGQHGLLRALSRTKGFEIDEILDWTSVRAVARCTEERNLLGLMTTEVKNYDMMFRLPNTKLSEMFFSHCAIQYSALASKPHMRLCLPAYNVEGKQGNMKVVLKKTTFDPEPTVALRHHRISDQMNLFCVADVAEVFRKHGDNTILFSGLAWRFRQTEVQKGKEKLEKAAAAEDASQEKKSYKSFLLILTNCAFYQCTKGGYEIVRRTELSAITKVMVSVDDPDAILMFVPSEYDIFCRIEGRAKEFLDRLQEAKAAWTDYGFYLPSERPGSHSISKYAYPVESGTNLTALGSLEKPEGFNNIQAQRNAADVRKQYMMWFHRDIKLSFNYTLPKPEVTVKVVLPEQEEGDEGEAETKGWSTEYEEQEVRTARVRFASARAYLFGFRANQLETMALAAEEVSLWEKRKSCAAALTQALRAEDADQYEKTRVEAEVLEGLDTLLAEQEPQYNELQQKKNLIEKIALDIDGDELEASVHQLARYFEEARAINVKSSVLESLRLELDRKLQLQRLLRLADKNADERVRALGRSCAERLKAPPDVTARFNVDSAEVAYLKRLLESAILTGNLKTLHEACNRVRDSGAAAQLTQELAEADEAQRVLTANADMIGEVSALASQIRNHIDKMNPSEVLDVRAKFLKVMNATQGQKALTNTHVICKMYYERFSEMITQREDKLSAEAKEAEAREEYEKRLKEREEQLIRIQFEAVAREEQATRARNASSTKRGSPRLPRW